jgi:hypothetical protein
VADEDGLGIMLDSAGYVDKTFISGWIIAWGKTSKADGNTIAHGLGATPLWVGVTATAAKRKIATTTWTSTTFTLKLQAFNDGT